jgi:hypothetical protein
MFRIARCLEVVALLCFASSAFGTQMKLTSVGNGYVMGGVYIGPYTATIGGVRTEVICDDFTTDISVGMSWTANMYTLSQVTPSGPQKFTTPEWQGYTIQNEYDAAALLAEQLMQPPNMNNPALAGYYSYAIWTIFDPSAVDGYGAGNALTPAQVNHVDALRTSALADAAAGQAPSGAVSLYTPNPLKASQEFLVVRTPEPPAAATLGVDLLALAALTCLMRHRIVRETGHID